MWNIVDLLTSFIPHDSATVYPQNTSYFVQETMTYNLGHVGRISSYITTL